jgi:hypothetical protein
MFGRRNVTIERQAAVSDQEDDSAIRPEPTQRSCVAARRSAIATLTAAITGSKYGARYRHDLAEPMELLGRSGGCATRSCARGRTCAPLLAALGAPRATVVTPFMPPFTPVLTPLHPNCLGLSLGNR